MGTAEAVIDGRQFAANNSKTPRHHLANLLRKLRIMKPEPTSSELCNLTLQKAISEAGMMNLGAALAIADEALWHEPDNIQAIIIKGMIYMDLGKLNLANDEFIKAVGIARRMTETTKNSMLSLDSAMVDIYISMRLEKPVDGIRHVMYVPIGQGITDLAIGAFERAKKNFEYAVHFSSEKTNE